MDDPPKVARGPRRTSEEIQQIVAEFATSGVSQREFCRSRGISLTSLNIYLRRQRVPAGECGASHRFLAVEVSQASGSSGNGGRLVVALASGRRIEVERGFDAATLERLLMILDKG